MPQKIGTHYVRGKHAKYVRTLIGKEPKGPKKWRMIKLPRGRRLLLAIQGGKSKAVALLRPKSEMKGKKIQRLK